MRVESFEIGGQMVQTQFSKEVFYTDYGVFVVGENNGRKVIEERLNPYQYDDWELEDSSVDSIEVYSSDESIFCPYRELDSTDGFCRNTTLVVNGEEAISTGGFCFDKPQTGFEELDSCEEKGVEIYKFPCEFPLDEHQPEVVLLSNFRKFLGTNKVEAVNMV